VAQLCLNFSEYFLDAQASLYGKGFINMKSLFHYSTHATLKKKGMRKLLLSLRNSFMKKTFHG